jgi:glutamyl-tRNA synthetase
MIKNNKKIRVRIAPSPTGNLHIGTARTALFNWLYARASGGTFILRIEDTDLERSDKKYEKNIFEGLEWLGLGWDEGPYRQSERLDIYEKYISQLLEKGLAYWCDCSKDTLESERKIAESKGLAPKYSGTCRNKKLSFGSIIRFRIPEEKITFKDLIRDEISFDGALIGDIAIAKNTRTPLYNFAVVIDDYEMQISHVIRGEDHIANTPKQTFIQLALGFPVPQYAHLPLILDKNRAKLSKRFAATSVDEYRAEGFLPEALTNFLALLGWHPEENKEIMPTEEIISKFSLARIQKSGAVFDIDKLKWLNSQYIRQLSEDELVKRLENFNEKTKKFLAQFSNDQKIKIATVAKERMETLADFLPQNKFFGEIDEYDPKLLIWKKSDRKRTLKNLTMVRDIIEESLENYSKEEAENSIMPIAEKLGKGDVLWPLRVSVSASDTSPGPFEIMEIIGRETTIQRLDHAIDKLSKTKD